MVEQRVGQHLDEVGYLAVGAEAQGAEDEADGDVLELGDELADGGDGGIVFAGSAEDELKAAGVGLAAMAAEGLHHGGVKAFDGLEEGDGGGAFRSEHGQVAAGVGAKTIGGKEGEQGVSHAGDDERGGGPG